MAPNNELHNKRTPGEAMTNYYYFIKNLRELLAIYNLMIILFVKSLQIEFTTGLVHWNEYFYLMKKITAIL